MNGYPITLRTRSRQLKTKIYSDKELWNMHGNHARLDSEAQAPNIQSWRKEQAKQDYATTFGLLAARGIVVEPYPDLGQPIDFLETPSKINDQLQSDIAEGQMYLFGVECE